MSEPLVRIDQLTKRYGTLVALDGVSLDVPAGEIVTLVGPNGAGKTTALKLLVGLLAPTAGRVTIGGLDVHRQPVEAKRLLSFVPDQPYLYEPLTAGELLSFIGGIYDMPSEELERRGLELLELFGMREIAGRRIAQLSYGMRSRLALIGALLHRPRVLIMDEPFFGLDPQTLRLIKQLLLDEAQRGMAIILSTHQLAIVEDIASRVAIMAHGRVRALGTLDALRRAHGAHDLESLFFQLTAPA